MNARLVASHPKLSPDGNVLYWNAADEPTMKVSALMHAKVTDVLPAVLR